MDAEKDNKAEEDKLSVARTEGNEEEPAGRSEERGGNEDPAETGDIESAKAAFIRYHDAAAPEKKDTARAPVDGAEPIGGGGSSSELLNTLLDGFALSIEALPTNLTVTAPLGPGAHAIEGTGGPSILDSSANNSNSNNVLQMPTEEELGDLEEQQTEGGTEAGVSIAGFLCDADDESQAKDPGGVSNDLTTGMQDISGTSATDIERATAKPWPEEQDNSRIQRKHFVVLLLVMTLVGTVVILMLVFFLGDNSNDSPTLNEESNKAPPPTPHPFQEDLPASILKIIQEDPDSAEYQANSWMWNDPHLGTYSKQRQRRRFGLVTLYHATGGDDWINNSGWLDYEVSECDWFSKTPLPEEDICDDTSGTYILDLHANNLTGSLPFAFWLSKPKILDVSHNSIQGQLPIFPADLRFLETFIISSNNFTGVLQAEGGLDMSNVLVIRIDDNGFRTLSGAYNMLYKFLPSLQVFNISHNQFDGALSTNLGHLTSLQHLMGGNKHIVPCTLPTELGLLTDLETLDYHGTVRLQGTVPSELMLLTKLTTFDMTGTGLTGRLPVTFCENERLKISVNCSMVQCCG